MIENKAVGKSLKKKVTFEGDQKKKKVSSMEKRIPRRMCQQCKDLEAEVCLRYLRKEREAN